MDIKPPKSEDEYHFSETNSSNLFGLTTSSTRAGILEKLKNKNVITAISFVIILFVLYKFFGMLFSSSKRTTIQKAPVKKMQPMTTETGEGGTAMDQFNSRVSAMEQRHAYTDTRIEKLETTVSSVSANVTQIQTQLTDLNNTLQILSNQITQQQSQLTALQEGQKKVEVVVKPRHVRRRGYRSECGTESGTECGIYCGSECGPPCEVRSSRRSKYYLQGLVPGRAWLRARDGETLTVQVGDKVPGYGTVQVIDPAKSVVVTSSGILIRYSPADR